VRERMLILQMGKCGLRIIRKGSNLPPKVTELPLAQPKLSGAPHSCDGLLHPVIPATQEAKKRGLRQALVKSETPSQPTSQVWWLICVIPATRKA
jgi:hypothetical protein